MSGDPRDEPNVTWDVNGDATYHTKDGHSIRMREGDDPRTLQEMEAEMRFYQQFPMGMK